MFWEYFLSTSYFPLFLLSSLLPLSLSPSILFCLFPSCITQSLYHDHLGSNEGDARWWWSGNEELSLSLSHHLSLSLSSSPSHLLLLLSPPSWITLNTFPLILSDKSRECGERERRSKCERRSEEAKERLRIPVTRRVDKKILQQEKISSLEFLWENVN